MRILHCIHSVNPRIGGPIVGLKSLAALHQLAGREVEVASLDAPDAPGVRDGPLQVHALGPGLLKYGYSRRLVPWLRRHHADYDVVIVNGIWQYHSFAVWRALRPMRRPYYVFTHGMLDPWFKQQYPLKHLKKCLYWPWAEYRVLRDARAVLFTTAEERELAHQSFRRYRCREVVLGYGTQPPLGDAAGQREVFQHLFPECRGKRVWLFLGRLHPKKGCDLVLQAFARFAAHHPELHLVLAGPDQDGWQSHLQALSTRLGLEGRITWPGMLEGDLKWGAFRTAEVFVLPSHQENFGIAVTEAMACGIPVLISTKVNIWQEIQSHDAGLVEADDLGGTLRLCSRWLKLSPSERQMMGERARWCFQEQFDAQQVVDRLMALWWADGIGTAASVNSEHGPLVAAC